MLSTTFPLARMDFRSQVSGRRTWCTSSFALGMWARNQQPSASRTTSAGGRPWKLSTKPRKSRRHLTNGAQWSPHDKAGRAFQSLSSALEREHGSCECQRRSPLHPPWTGELLIPILCPFDSGYSVSRLL